MSSILLDHSPSDIVAKLLVDIGQASNPGDEDSWPVYNGRMPDASSVPDNCITVYDTSPQPAGRSQITGEVFQHYGIQLIVRGATYPLTYIKSNALMTNITEGLMNRLVSLEGSVYVVTCFSKVNLLRMGQEVPSSRRWLVSINAIVAMRQVS